VPENPLRVGVIGANAVQSWAKDSHIPAIASSDLVRLEAVATSRSDTAAAAAEAFGAPQAFADALDLVASRDVDIVSICVKVPHHRTLVLAALSAGKHVYCEWPLGRNVEEALEMEAAATAAGVHVAVGVQARMNPAARQARDIIERGGIGRPLSVAIRSTTAGYAARLPSGYAYLNLVENGANLVTILGGHTMDLAALVVGGLSSLNATTTFQHPVVTLTDTGEDLARTAPDHLLVQGRTAGGAAFTMEVSGDRPAGTPFVLEVTGDAGVLRLTGGHPHGFQAGRLSLSVNDEPLIQPEFGPAQPEGAVNVFAMYDRLAQDIMSGSRTVPDFGHAARLTRLMSDVFVSADSGRRVLADGWLSV